MFDEIGFESAVITEMNSKANKLDENATNDPADPKLAFITPQAVNNQESRGRETSVDIGSNGLFQNTCGSDETEQPSMISTAMQQTRSSVSSTDDYSMNPTDYRLDEAIGYGSSAIVHLATYLPMQTQVAIKIIDLDRFEQNQIDTLRREIQVMRMCRHPNLLGVLASFVHDSQLWIVTPFLGAGSCLDLLRVPANRNGLLNEAAIASILLQALQGLAYLHEHGHIHRDVKAGNLLIDIDGQVQLADFGVSASLTDYADNRGGAGSSGAEGAMRIRKTFVGTPCWMAPEVMEMTRGYDAKADIWSFGITAYELANGHAPYARLPAMKVIFVTLSNEAPKFNRHRTRVTFSRAFKEMIQLCLQKDPEKRPTAEVLLKHPFFKQAKKKEYLVSELLASMPPIQQRAKAHVAKVSERRRSRPETIPEEEAGWDFDSSSCSEGAAVDDEDGLDGDPWDATHLQTLDKRGRFLVEPGAPAATSQMSSPLTADEQQQVTVQSDERISENQAEIRKGRFSVNPSVNTPESGVVSPSGENRSMPSASAAAAAALFCGMDEDEGRKSRFEVVLPSPQELAAPRPRLSSQPPGHHSSAAALGIDEISGGGLHHRTAPSAPPVLPGHYQPQGHHPPHSSPHHPANGYHSRSSVHHERQPDLYPPPQAGTAYWHPPTLIDYLLHQSELMRQSLLELRARWPYYGVSSYQPTGPSVMTPAPAFDFYNISPQQSPVSSVHASQGDISNSGALPSAAPTSLRSPTEPLENLERQLAQLRMENEQLRRRQS